MLFINIHTHLYQDSPTIFGKNFPFSTLVAKFDISVWIHLYFDVFFFFLKTSKIKSTITNEQWRLWRITSVARRNVDTMYHFSPQ